jgi:hypothetical protein
MSEPGPAQLELIRRYARTMRELHADAMRARGPRIGAREGRRAVGGAEPLIEVAKTLAADARAIASDVTPGRRKPAAPA